MKTFALLVVIVTSLGGCALFEDRPDHSCKKTSDCLQAQGETCDQTTQTCVQAPDAQIVTPLAPEETP